MMSFSLPTIRNVQTLTWKEQGQISFILTQKIYLYGENNQHKDNSVTKFNNWFTPICQHLNFIPLIITTFLSFKKKNLAWKIPWQQDCWTMFPSNIHMIWRNLKRHQCKDGRNMQTRRTSCPESINNSFPPFLDRNA